MEEDTPMRVRRGLLRKNGHSFYIPKETYPFYNRRLKIRPGVSGWAQINQPFDTDVKDVHQKLKYDFYYIENLSLRLDAHILFRTLWVVLRGHSK